MIKIRSSSGVADSYETRIADETNKDNFSWKDILIRWNESSEKWDVMINGLSIASVDNKLEAIKYVEDNKYPVDTDFEMHTYKEGAGDGRVTSGWSVGIKASFIDSFGVKQSFKQTKSYANMWIKRLVEEQVITQGMAKKMRAEVRSLTKK